MPASHHLVNPAELQLARPTAADPSVGPSAPHGQIHMPTMGAMADILGAPDPITHHKLWEHFAEGPAPQLASPSIVDDKGIGPSQALGDYQLRMMPLTDYNMPELDLGKTQQEQRETTQRGRD